MFENETEADTRANRIDPVLKAADWEARHLKREEICPGRITAGGRRSNPRNADYVLRHKGQVLAVIEAKKRGLGHTEGVAQAKDYATRLKAPFAYSTNGDRWYEIDVRKGSEKDIVPFPTPDELWDRCFSTISEWRNRFGDVPFETEGGKWQPRYYQHNAINAVLEAIAGDKRRILLTLATGTGKTSIAFQIAWKLFHARWNIQRDAKRRPRILFLADRNVLANQAYNSFSAFDADALTRITPAEIRKRRGMPKNASVFFTIFQTFMTGDNDEEEQDEGLVLSEDLPEASGGAGFKYQEYAPDFFDFIIIDECHRGGANDESTWRQILEYFEPATQLGLTATPKRTGNADTYRYFGEPVYTYALKEGIDDGFLTPFKVRQMASTIDQYVFGAGDTVTRGEIEQGRTYTEGDFNTNLVIEDREMSRVAEFMGQINQREKTLVFCATQEHAARVRDYINQIADSTNVNYCHRVTAADGKQGEEWLETFKDNDKTIPTILTTSQKLSTGVDARNIRNIVLMRPVKSMIEFKQIIGRGTRTYEGKDFFTVYDFVRAYEHFQDPEWDGEPLEPDPPKQQGNNNQPTGLNDPDDGGWIDDSPKPPRAEMVYVTLSDGRKRQIHYLATTLYFGLDGSLISPQEFMEKLFGDLSGLIGNEDQLRAMWSDPAKREMFRNVLADMGYDDEKLDAMRKLIDAPKSDLFDVLAYVRFTLPTKTRTDRADAARANALSGYETEMQDFLKAVLAAYERDGVSELGLKRIGTFLDILYGGTDDAKRALGELSAIKSAFVDVQGELYRN